MIDKKAETTPEQNPAAAPPFAALPFADDNTAGSPAQKIRTQHSPYGKAVNFLKNRNQEKNSKAKAKPKGKCKKPKAKAKRKRTKKKKQKKQGRLHYQRTHKNH
ncbi:hypothetical protein [Pedobacter miscanthi]|uniref:Uncharacterized protein n=1 Tax=Pedobacter miscanthi TaxID=2259170 RepID=A0A366KKH4_9SPHI|nr:hypothetical protein [Pedobacter miscanthi]RBQ02196.1 hypothetical protein DRW42_27970 [Pedobacter miscanthi]